MPLGATSASTVSKTYALWRIAEFPLQRFPPERVWRQPNGQLYYSRHPDRETPEAVEAQRGMYWAPDKNAWYARLKRNLREIGQANPVCIHAHLGPVPKCIRGSSRCWALAQLGHTTVDALVSLPLGIHPSDLGLQGLPVEATDEAVKAQFTDCNTTHFDSKEWDARPPQIEVYEANARRLRRK